LHTGDWWGNGEPVKISAMRGVPGDPIGVIEDIHFSNISCQGENTILLYASDETRLKDIHFSNFNFTLKKSALDRVSGGNFDLRPNIIPGKEIFMSDVPVVHIENAENISFIQGRMGWEGTGASYYTHAVMAVKVDNLRMSHVAAIPSPSNPELRPVFLKSCRKADIQVDPN